MNGHFNVLLFRCSKTTGALSPLTGFFAKKRRGRGRAWVWGEKKVPLQPGVKPGPDDLIEYWFAFSQIQSNEVLKTCDSLSSVLYEEKARSSGFGDQERSPKDLHLPELV